MSVETILKDLQSAVAALEQIDEDAVDSNRRIFIADQLRAHANRVAPWTRCYPLMALYVGNLVEEVRKRWEWPKGVSVADLMDIVQRAAAVVSFPRCRRRELPSYSPR